MSTTIYVKFIPSAISDYWLADLDDLEMELKKIMPDVKRYISNSFKSYKHYLIQDISSCCNSDLPAEPDGITIIELVVIPKNI